MGVGELPRHYGENQKTKDFFRLLHLAWTDSMCHFCLARLAAHTVQHSTRRGRLPSPFTGQGEGNDGINRTAMVNQQTGERIICGE